MATFETNAATYVLMEHHKLWRSKNKNTALARAWLSKLYYSPLSNSLALAATPVEPWPLLGFQDPKQP